MSRWSATAPASRGSPKIAGNGSTAIFNRPVLDTSVPNSGLHWSRMVRSIGWLIATVLTSALVASLAGGSPKGAAPPAVIGGDPALRRVLTPEPRTIESIVSLTGTVVRAPAVGVDAGISGVVDRVMVKVGDQVSVGAVLASVTAASGNGAVARTELKAPESGTVADVVKAGAATEPTTKVATVTIERFDIVAPVVPVERQYALVDAPTAVRAGIVGGPVGFTCRFLGVEGKAQQNPQEPSSVALRCAIPAEVRVFAGLRATVVAVTGRSENVLALPRSAVVGSVDGGEVVVLAADGRSQRRTVRLGRSDDRWIEIPSGLGAHDRVLERPTAADFESAAS